MNAPYPCVPSEMDEIKLEVEQFGSARGLQDITRQHPGLRLRLVLVAPGLLPRGEAKARGLLDKRTRAEGRA